MSRNARDEWLRARRKGPVVRSGRLERRPAFVSNQPVPSLSKGSGKKSRKRYLGREIRLPSPHLVSVPALHQSVPRKAACKRSVQVALTRGPVLSSDFLAQGTDRGGRNRRAQAEWGTGGQHEGLRAGMGACSWLSPACAQVEHAGRRLHRLGAQSTEEKNAAIAVIAKLLRIHAGEMRAPVVTLSYGPGPVVLLPR